MEEHSQPPRRNPRLMRILAVGSPVVGVLSLALGIVELAHNDPSGYMSIILGVVMLALGYTYVRILAGHRNGQASSGEEHNDHPEHPTGMQ